MRGRGAAEELLRPELRAPPTQRSHEPSANGQDNFIISFPRAEPSHRHFNPGKGLPAFEDPAAAAKCTIDHAKM